MQSAAVVSDLWGPLAVLALLAVVPAALHFAWAQARWAYLKKRSLHSPAARAQTASAAPLASTTAAPPFDGLTPLDALTAQRRPVVLLEEYWPADTGMVDDTDAVNPASDGAPAEGFSLLPLHSPSPLHSPLPLLVPSPAHSMPPNAGRTEPYLAQAWDAPPPKPTPSQPLPARVAVLTVAPPALQTPSPAALLPPHAVMQYVIRLVWQRPPSKDAVHAALADLPWPGAMPVQHWLNPSGTALELGLYLVNRKHAAQARDFAAFERWARVLAGALGADEPPEFLAETALLQTRAAQNLLADLDTVFNVRLHVPASQLNLFEQLLIAARFSAVDEHWSYQESKQSEGLWLERLWGAPAAAESQAAIFQMAIDIPHLGVLEARKAYMRLRALARASAAIVQTDQGTHLSEGMIEKFAREITARQEMLAKAGIEPGSASARTLFKPRIKMQKDFAAFHVEQV